jgi:hypothetical protein
MDAIASPTSLILWEAYNGTDREDIKKTVLIVAQFETFPRNKKGEEQTPFSLV